MSAASEGRAFGKAILLGEHAVVYGAPAIAVALDRGAHALVSPSENAESTLDLGGARFTADRGGEGPARAFAELLDAAGGPPESALRVVAKSELPPGGGLGSSAALGVAIARAVESHRQPLETDESRIVARAMAWERVFHGNPSGIDTQAAARGGVIKFSPAEGASSIALAREVPLCIGLSGTSCSTRAMVEHVARMRQRRPEVVDRAIDASKSLVRNAELALEAGDLVAVGKLMDLAQMVLAGLLVSTESQELLCSLARGAGALGAKLTGAGGGGAVIALAADAAPQASQKILETWERAGFDGFAVTVPAHGGIKSPT